MRHEENPMPHPSLETGTEPAMPRDRMSNIGERWLTVSKRLTAASCCAAVLVVTPCRAGESIGPGTTLDQGNADAAKDLLPPEIHAHYQKGEYTNPIVDFPNSAFQWDDGWAEATQWNREHIVLDPDKQPVDKSTGKRPDYITGYPFPDIREDDPDAGVKVLWNTDYMVYNGGNTHVLSSLKWLSPTGVDRSAGQDGFFLYYDGQPKHHIPPTNTENLLIQFLAVAL